jgi:predicted lactoylglutathione lyase
MEHDFPGAVPEIPVGDVDAAAAYYKDKLGFSIDWGSDNGGIAGISKGNCRMFLSNRAFREPYGNAAPVLVWINLNSKQEVDNLYEVWRRGEARIVSPPESKPWNLHEFTVADLDGNLFRVFYDFTWESREA